jgi:hypothetical protein
LPSGSARDPNLAAAAAREIQQVRELQAQLSAELTVVPLTGMRSMPAVAPVAADGSQNRLSYDPVRIEILRVVDSAGKEHLRRYIPLSAGTDVIAELFRDVPLLASFLGRLGFSPDAYPEAFPLLPRPDAGVVQDAGGNKMRGALQDIRDIAEWAACLELALTSPTSVLVLRDGLLRSMSFSRTALDRASELFRGAYERTGSLVVGVAKRSQLLDYLSLVLAVQGTFDHAYPCYAAVPESLERLAHKWQKEWPGPRSFGRMYLVKFSPDREGPVYPVDIPEWVEPARTRELLEYLRGTCRFTFPVPGYPQPLALAHEKAALGALERSLLESQVAAAVAELCPADPERIARRVHLAREAAGRNET